MKHNRTKNIILVVLVFAVLGLYMYLANSKSPSDIARLVVVQDKPQEWADALKLGLHDGLREQNLTEGIDVIVVPRSAAGNPHGLTGLAEAVAKQDVAIVYSLGTQSSQAVFRAVKNKPIIFGAVTDPIKAGFYDGSLNKPKSNITGTQDLWPYSAQFDLIVSLVSNAKKIGIFSCICRKW